jgi:hypothetical protein
MTMFDVVITFHVCDYSKYWMDQNISLVDFSH